jgi:signal transduction histidine kinase
VTRTEQILRWLRVALHVGFAALLLVGLLRALVPPAPGGGGTQAPPGVVLPLVMLLAGAYLAGTVLEKRRAQGAPFDPARYALPWLGAVCALWLVLVAVSGEFAWVVFPLFFLQLRLLPRWWGIAAVGATAVAVTVALWWHGGRGELGPALVLGPFFGAAFAVVTAVAYRALYAEAEGQRAAADELRRTRAELAESQHRAGVLAERERLARDIHDTLAQGFSSIVIVGRSAAKALDEGDAAAARERLGIVQTTAADSLAEARAFVRGLAPPALEQGVPAVPDRRGGAPTRDEGAPTPDGGAATRDESAAEPRLPAALRQLCARTASASTARGVGLTCRFETDGEPRALPEAAEEALLRAAQVSLANVWQHARARTAVVSLAYLDGEVTLDVFDDGDGFDPAALPDGPRPDGTGFGLRGLRDRIEAVGGTLVVESAPGEGTAPGEGPASLDGTAPRAGTVVAVRLPLPGGREGAT